MRTVALCALAVLAVTCGPSPDAKLPGFAASTGGTGSPGDGGTTGTGGTTTVGTGGTRATGTGGSTVTGTGGRTSGTGGSTGVGTGGRTTGTGGRTTGAGGSPPGTGGGTSGTGGTTGPGTGGATTTIPTGTGGRLGTGGATTGRDAGAGGITGTGGSTTGKDAANSTDDAPANCAGQIISNGYACGTATSCSACPSGKAAPCKASLDCIAPKYPCDNNCMLNCFNNNAADSVAQKCVTDLLTLACGTGC